MVVLVTGFEPYLDHRSNPTERLAREADGAKMGQARVIARVLPTEFLGCARELGRAIRETRPDAILMFGLAPRRMKVSIEAVALNVDHSEAADNAGKRPWRRAIVRGGPPAMEATAPVDRLFWALRRARIPAAVSYSAGTYVCNHAFYIGLLRAPDARVGFVHVPGGLAPRTYRRVLEVLVGALRSR